MSRPESSSPPACLDRLLCITRAATRWSRRVNGFSMQMSPSLLRNGGSQLRSVATSVEYALPKRRKARNELCACAAAMLAWARIIEADASASAAARQLTGNRSRRRPGRGAKLPTGKDNSVSREAVLLNPNWLLKMVIPLCLLGAISLASAQTAPANPPATVGKPSPAAVDPARVASLLEPGRCPEALPQIRKAYAHAVDKDLKRRLGAGGVRCAMSLDQTSAAVDFIQMLNRDFPKDPEVLYLTVHTYSDLSLRASQALLFTHPGAYQVHELNAESLE